MEFWLAISLDNDVFNLNIFIQVDKFAAINNPVVSYGFKISHPDTRLTGSDGVGYENFGT